MQGYAQWNTSAVVGFTSEFNKVTVDFVGNYLTSVTNNFVVIPEPSTSHLLLVVLRARVRHAVDHEKET